MSIFALPLIVDAVDIVLLWMRVVADAGALLWMLVVVDVGALLWMPAVADGNLLLQRRIP
jgi:hypothetical protein